MGTDDYLGPWLHECKCRYFRYKMGDSHIADFEYHEIPQVVKVITSVVLRLSRVAGGHEW